MHMYCDEFGTKADRSHLLPLYEDAAVSGADHEMVAKAAITTHTLRIVSLHCSLNFPAHVMHAGHSQ